MLREQMFLVLFLMKGWPSKGTSGLKVARPNVFILRKISISFMLTVFVLHEFTTKAKRCFLKQFYRRKTGNEHCEKDKKIMSTPKTM